MKNNNFKFNKKLTPPNLPLKRGGTKKGFGLLEVLLSGVIIIIILAALVFIGRAAMNSSVNTQERAQATYLAQMQLEMVRQIRDTNWLQTIKDQTTQLPLTYWNYFSINDTNSNDTNYIFSPLSLSATGNTLCYFSMPIQRVFVTNFVTNNQNINCGYIIVGSMSSNRDFSKETLDGKTFYLSVFRVNSGSSLMPNFSKASEDNSTGNFLEIESKVSDKSDFSTSIADEKTILTNWKPNY